MNSKLVIVFSLFISCVISSCNIYNPAEPVPSYIHVENLFVKIPSSEQNSSGKGSASSKISDAWVYIDENLIGCFEMPCTIPIISEGSHTLKIRPGIKVNGIAATRSPYPFYGDYIQSVNLQSGAITTITGDSVTYNSYMAGVSHFPMIEDFESTGFKIVATNNSEKPLTLVTSPAVNVFEGTTSALGSLRSSNTTFECATVDSFALNKSGAPVFLEFNYKNNNTFQVNVKGYTLSGTTITNTFQVQALSFNPSENWNKAYLYLTPAIAQLGAASRFQIYFLMKNYDAQDSIGLALDNIKIVQ